MAFACSAIFIPTALAFSSTLLLLISLLVAVARVTPLESSISCAVIYLFDLKTESLGFLFTPKILALIQCEEKGFGYLLEEVNKISKITNSFGEIPYILTVREKTFSRSKFSYSFPVYYRYLRWIFKR